MQDAKTGDLRDEALRALLRGLAADNRGLCIVTTRQQLPELNTWHSNTAPEWPLARLSKEAGAELLKKLGVKGTLAEREQLAADVKGHALTLTLLGKYLAEAHSGDIRKRDLVSLTEADYEETSGHAFHVMEAYERWLEKDCRRVELSILRLLGLFDRPATPDCLAALRQAPAISGLTDTLTFLTDANWNLAVKRLIQLGIVDEHLWEPHRVFGYNEKEATKAANWDYQLVEPEPFDPPEAATLTSQSLDSHPLVREYFGRRLREMSEETWRAGHSRLFEHLRASVPYWPVALDGLQPLYQAVTHGCQAGRKKETYDDVYRTRILRGESGPQAYYSIKILGALGAELAALGCFFVLPWTRPSPELTAADQVRLLADAASCLSYVGRLVEAREPMLISVQLFASKEEWRESSFAAGNLSELELALGSITSAVRAAEESVTFADRSGDGDRRFANRSTHANALHQAGQNEEARVQFEEAETLQREWDARHPLLYSIRGFQYCELLLGSAERAAWRSVLESASLSEAPMDLGLPPGPDLLRNETEKGDQPSHPEVLEMVVKRTDQTLSLATSQNWLLDIGLDHLTLGRASLFQNLLDPRGARIVSMESRAHLEEAVCSLRESGSIDNLPRGLLTRAWLLTMLGQISEAQADLDEAQHIAERGPMPLHLTDVHLHRARLFFRDNLAAARGDLKQARALIEKCGYLRRMPELEDAEKVIFAMK